MEAELLLRGGPVCRGSRMGEDAVIAYAIPMVEGMSIREAARTFGLHRDTVCKMLEYSVPPGYLRRSAPRRTKLVLYTSDIDQILEKDHSVPERSSATLPSASMSDSGGVRMA